MSWIVLGGNALPTWCSKARPDRGSASRIVANRYLLVALFGGFQFLACLADLSFAHDISSNQAASLISDALLGGSEIAAVAVLWLAFFPPTLLHELDHPTSRDPSHAGGRIAMATDLFDIAAEKLEGSTDMDRLAARGTLRIALKEAGLDAHKLTIPQLRAVFERADAQGARRARRQRRHRDV